MPLTISISGSTRNPSIAYLVCLAFLFLCFWAWFAGLRPADYLHGEIVSLPIFADPSYILNEQLITYHKSGRHCDLRSTDGPGSSLLAGWFVFTVFRPTKLRCFSCALYVFH